MKVTIYGAGGRMGQALTRLCHEADDIQIIGAVDTPSSPHIGRDVGELSGAGNAGVELSADLASALLGADLLIDFTIADAFDNMLRAAVKAEVAVVSGTTRLTEASLQRMAQAAESIPVLWAPNMSVGVQLLAQLVKQAVAALEGYDVVIGSRYIPGGGVANWPTARKLLSRAANLYTQILLRLPVHDCTAGFRSYSREVLETVDPFAIRAQGYSFLEEMVWRVHRCGFRIIEIPIRYHARRYGASEIAPFRFRHGLKLARMVGFAWRKMKAI